MQDLKDHITPLVLSTDNDELAKRFDYLMYTIEYADLQGQVATKLKNRVVDTAAILSTLVILN